MQVMLLFHMYDTLEKKCKPFKIAQRIIACTKALFYHFLKEFVEANIIKLNVRIFKPFPHIYNS
jgi:hypothetical protein